MDMEFYFIQLLFNKNVDLLKQANRALYDELYLKYRKMFISGRNRHIDISDINKAFIHSI